MTAAAVTWAIIAGSVAAPIVGAWLFTRWSIRRGH